MNTTFYEIIASKICGTSPEDLFKKTRDQDPVLARFFCIIYRKDVLGMSGDKAAKRYYRDHAIYHYAKKKVQEYHETKDERYDKYLQFVEECAEFVAKSDTAVNTLHLKISMVGLGGYLEGSMRMFSEFFKYATENQEELAKYQLNLCMERLNEIKLLYE